MVNKIELKLTFTEWLCLINKPKHLIIETESYIYESINNEYFFITTKYK